MRSSSFERERLDGPLHLGGADGFGQGTFLAYAHIGLAVGDNDQQRPDIGVFKEMGFGHLV